MAKRILFFANSRYPRGAANSVNVFRMATAFETLGHDVVLFGLRVGSPFTAGLWGETCRRYGSDSKIKARLLWWPFKRGVEPYLAFVAIMILAFARRRAIVYTRVRYVATVANSFGFRTYFESHAPPGTGFQKRIDRWLLASNRCRLIVISHALQNIYRNLGINTGNFSLAPDAGRPHRPSTPNESEFHGPALNIGYIGSLYSGRGLEIIVALAKCHPDKRFHVIGRIHKKTASSNGRPSNLIFYDEVTPNQADRLATLFDVLLMPYQKQVLIGNGIDTSAWMSPMKMFEFMLSGRPIIASRLPAICEILKDSEEALLVDPSDETGWNEALSKLDDPKLRRRLATNAYRQASQKHTWEIRARSILENNYGK